MLHYIQKTNKYKRSFANKTSNVLQDELTYPPRNKNKKGKQIILELTRYY